MKKLLVVLIAAFALIGCSDEPKARSTLIKAGYTDIQTTGYSLFGCDRNDGFSTGFKATGPTGIHTEGVVCSGWLKSSTIRIN